MIIGLVGRSCSGKDTVASFLDKDKFEVIDVDKLGHSVLEKEKESVEKEFGSSVIQDGKVDRKALSKIVFSSPEKLKALEAITHPKMKEETEKIAKEIEKNGKVAVINAALLERMKLDSICNEIWLVLSPYEKRLERALSRDGVTEESFKKRTEAQKDIGNSIYSLKKPIFTIINDKGKEELCRQIKIYCDRINARGFK